MTLKVTSAQVAKLETSVIVNNNDNNNNSYFQIPSVCAGERMTLKKKRQNTI